MFEPAKITARRTRQAMLLALLAVAAQAPSAWAQAAPQAGEADEASAPALPGISNINITPRRVVFDPAHRTAAVYVFNQGTVPVTVDVSLADNVMLPSGEIVPMDRVAAKGAEAQAIAARMQSARDLLLAAPSRLTLPPGQGRTIRLRATMPTQPAAGEYRSHLTVTAVPPPDAGVTAEQAAAAQNGELVLRIRAIFGLSIPLIIRPAGATATGSFGTITASDEDGKPALLIPIERTGTASLYGNIEARASNGDVIGLMRGVGVYPEIGERFARMPLSRPLTHGETVIVTYSADDAKAGDFLARGKFTAP